MKNTADISYHGTVVVFDLDDTLYKERTFVRSGINAIADHLAAVCGAVDPHAASERMWCTYLDGGNFINEGKMLALESGCVAEIEDAGLLEIYRYHKPSIKLLEDAKRLLDTLQGGGVKLALITDGRSMTQRNKIRALRLDAYFAPDAIYISEEQGVDKHAPLSFRKVMRSFPEAKEFLYIGDNPAKDFTWPLMLGWTAVCLADNGENIFRQLPEDMEKLRRERNFRVVENLSEVSVLPELR
jgi:putative hydrolase of the HAD superfamily